MHLVYNENESCATIQFYQTERGTMSVDVNEIPWIKNTQTQCRYPESLYANARIEVKFNDEYNDGGIDYGVASDWSITWNINNATHIIEYRVFAE